MTTMPPIQFQSLGLFANSVLLGPGGLNWGLATSRRRINFDTLIDPTEWKQTQQTLKDLAPHLQRTGINVKRLVAQLHKMESGSGKIFHEDTTEADWSALMEIAETLESMALAPYRAAADSLAMQRNLAVRLYAPDTWYHDRLTQTARLMEEDLSED